MGVGCLEASGGMGDIPTHACACTHTHMEASMFIMFNMHVGWCMCACMCVHGVWGTPHTPTPNPIHPPINLLGGPQESVKIQ